MNKLERRLKQLEHRIGRIGQPSAEQIAIYRQRDQKFSERLTQLSDKDLDRLSDFIDLVYAQEMAAKDGFQWGSLTITRQQSYIRRSSERTEDIKQMSNEEFLQCYQEMKERQASKQPTMADIEKLDLIEKFLDDLQGNEGATQ